MRHLLPLVLAISISPLGCGKSALPRIQTNSAKTFKSLNEEIFVVVKNLGYGAAMPRYRAAADSAIAAGDAAYSIKFLNNLGGCQMAVFQFQDALKTLTEAKLLAEKSGQREVLAGVNSNISSLFQQMGNFPEAARSAEEALLHVKTMAPLRQAKILAQLGAIRAKIGRLDLAEKDFSDAINLALQSVEVDQTKKDAIKKEAGDVAASAWDSLGYARLSAGKIEEADAAVTEGFRLRRICHLTGIDSSYKNLAEIRAEQGQLSTALRLIGEAELAVRLPNSATPPWWIYLQRGKIEMRAGDLESALTDLRRSRDLARDWRVEVVANDANRTSLEGELADNLYQHLIDAGNRLYLETHRESLIRETFESAEENRAASLRALLPQSNHWRTGLHPNYYTELARLKQIETDKFGQGGRDYESMLAHLRTSLEAMEAQAGAPVNKQTETALGRAMRTLDKRSVLLSFQLTDSGSWLWTITDQTIQVHLLPARGELARRIKSFQAAIAGNQPTLKAQGAELYAALFSQVDLDIARRERWVLLLDRELFELPFPALSGSTGRFLVEEHSLEIGSSALMLGAKTRPMASERSFLGVGDPIYNTADPRRKNATENKWRSILSPASYRGGPAFARLWGTAKEIESSARAWDAPRSLLLEGQDASPEKFWEAARAKPDIIHFATHVVEGNSEPRNSWIALALGEGSQVEYITPGDILARTVSARLVVLSGCSSGAADAPTATGLRGLTRAWIAAGAGAVLATRWPTVDDDGVFFQVYYRHLRQNDNIDPAEALRQASLEMLKTGGWRSNPSFWAGYFLVGNL